MLVIPGRMSDSQRLQRLNLADIAEAQSYHYRLDFSATISWLQVCSTIGVVYATHL